MEVRIGSTRRSAGLCSSGIGTSSGFRKQEKVLRTIPFPDNPLIVAMLDHGADILPVFSKTISLERDAGLVLQSFQREAAVLILAFSGPHFMPIKLQCAVKRGENFLRKVAAFFQRRLWHGEDRVDGEKRTALEVRAYLGIGILKERTHFRRPVSLGRSWSGQRVYLAGLKKRTQSLSIGSFFNHEAI